MRALTAEVEADFPDPNSPVTIIDVGTGAGDLPRLLAGWTRDSRRPPTNDGRPFPDGINRPSPGEAAKPGPSRTNGAARTPSVQST